MLYSSTYFSTPRFASSRLSGDNNPDAVAFDGAMAAFDFSVALWIVRTGTNVFHATESNEVPEVSGDELRSVVGDDSGCHAGELFASRLHEDCDVDLFHLVVDVPLDDTSAESIKDCGHEVERAGDVEVRDIDVPVFVSHQWLLKPGSF